MNKYRSYEACPDCGASAFPYRYFGSNEWEYKCMADGWHRFKVSKAEPEPTLVEYQRTNDAMDALSESMNPTLPELDSYEDGPIDGYDY